MKVSDLGNKWFAVYKRCLYDFRMKDAAAIATYYRPGKLYKYFSFSSEYWRQNVFNGEIAFNIPSNFNDPLDSRWFLDYERILTDRFHDIGIEWSQEEYGPISVELYEEDLMYLRNMFYVSCFSSTPYANLMWGHYADKHNGFCIEYDVSLLPREMQLILPVVYVDKPYDASLILDMRGITDRFAKLCPSLFKSIDWKYEKEWRSFIPNTNAGELHIVSAVNAITGVYFGLKCYGPERNELEQWAEKQNIPRHQIERSYLSFDLISDNVEDIRSRKKIKGILI